jgi:hypothetical protein
MKLIYLYLENLSGKSSVHNLSGIKVSVNIINFDNSRTQTKEYNLEIADGILYRVIYLRVFIHHLGCHNIRN